jgi:hypothetical protein
LKGSVEDGFKTGRGMIVAEGKGFRWVVSIGKVEDGWMFEDEFYQG